MPIRYIFICEKSNKQFSAIFYRFYLFKKKFFFNVEKCVLLKNKIKHEQFSLNNKHLFDNLMCISSMKSYIGD